MKKSKNGEKKIKKNINSNGLEDTKKTRKRFSLRNEKFINLKDKMKLIKYILTILFSPILLLGYAFMIIISNFYKEEL